jgi:uncharacterized cupredoxin-like copper-binding protein
VALALLVAGGCAHGDTEPSAAATVVPVVLRDFQVSEVSEPIPAGEVVLRVENRGPETHELLVAGPGIGEDDLPMRADGLTIDEDALGDRVVGVVEGESPDAREDLDLQLEPGRYVLFCNMAGHYLGGMYTEIEVA